MAEFNDKFKSWISQEQNSDPSDPRTDKKEDRSQNKESKEVRNFIHKELHRSSFSRSFNIEEELYDVDKISAEMNDGILTLKIPKKVKEEVKPQKVVNVEIN